LSDIEPKSRNMSSVIGFSENLPNRDGGAAQAERRDDDVDAAAVLEAGVG